MSKSSDSFYQACPHCGGKNTGFEILGGGVAGVVGIEGGVVSGVLNLELSGVGASDWRPRHEELYQEV